LSSISVPEAPTVRATRRDPAGSRSKMLALAVIVTCQLMVVLDATVVNIALPGIQHSLHFSATSLSWVVNAYALTFGGLMLLGGRAGDILGRRRVFMFGIGLFTAASLLGGFANSAAWLLTARAVQGVGGAIASPTALALITSNFAEGRERTRAMGVYAAVSAGGGSLGLVLGGMLTDWASWRWVLFINVPIGLVLIALTPRFLAETEKRPGHFDVTGAIASTAGIAAVVYGFIRAASDGWSDSLTIGAFIAGVVLLGGFFMIETRAAQPIVPLRLFADRNRATAYASRLFLVAGVFGMFFFLPQFLQDVLGFSPLKAGLALLPMTGALFVTAQVVARVLPRTGPKPLMVGGAALATGGLAWLSQISATSGYVDTILGPTILIAIGMAPLFVTLTLAALAGVAPKEAGAAAGMVNVMQQVGGALGLSVLVTVFGSASRHAAHNPVVGGAVAQAHHVMAAGVSSAFVVATISAAIVLVLVTVAIRSKPAVRPAAPVQHEVEPAA
jgi:EmrB/QacA subfamily drug resistance transporter